MSTATDSQQAVGILLSDTFQSGTVAVALDPQH